MKTVADLRRALIGVPGNTPLRILDLEDEIQFDVALGRYWDKATISDEADYNDSSEEDVRMTMMNDGVDEKDYVIYIQQK